MRDAALVISFSATDGGGFWSARWALWCVIFVALPGWRCRVSRSLYLSPARLYDLSRYPDLTNGVGALQHRTTLSERHTR